LDELAEQGEEIEEQLNQAVAAENYSLASEMSAELRELKAQDYVEVASQALQQALEIEDYQHAAALRDRAGLGLLGWWAGKSTTTTNSTNNDSNSTSSTNDHGHLLYVSKDFGRVVGEAFSAKDLASLVEQRRPLDSPDNGASILMSATSSIGSTSLGALEDAFSGFMDQDEQQIEYGRPVFEVFLKPNGSSDEGGDDGDASLNIQQKVAAIRVHPDKVNQVMPSMVESLAEVITGDLTDNGQKVVSVESGADEDGEFVRINLSSGKSDDNVNNDNDEGEINVENFLEKFYEEEEAAEKKKNDGAEQEMDGIHARRYADVANTAEEEGELTSFESMQIQFQRVPADIKWQGRDAFTITVDDTINSITTDYYHEHDESTSSTTAEAAMLAISNNNNNNDDESSPIGTTPTTATTDEILEKPVQETIEDLKARLVSDSDDLTLESLAAEIEAIQAERLKRKEGNNSNDKDKDDKEIFNKVFTKVMKAAMEDEKIMDRDNGMLFFNSVADGNTLAYSRLPPSQATKTDPLSGLFIGAFGPHGPEIVQVTRTNKKDGEEWVVATKLTGDVNVPAGKISFKAKVGRAARLSISEAYPPELGVVARYKGQGMVAKEGYKHPKWVDGELLQLSKSNPLTKGAELGFVFALDGLRRYLILFAKLDLDEIAEMRENNNN